MEPVWRRDRIPDTNVVSFSPMPQRRRASGARYHTIKAILVHALDRQPLPGLTPVASNAAVSPPRHARPWTTFFPDPESEDRRSLAWT